MLAAKSEGSEFGVPPSVTYLLSVASYVGEITRDGPIPVSELEILAHFSVSVSVSAEVDIRYL